jgi:hypothetical protein
MDVLAGGRAVLRGVLRPVYGGRLVALQLRTGRGWTTVDSDRTDGRGRFVLHAPAGRPGSRPVRVVFAGDLANAPTVRSLGRLNVYRRAAVSWYGPGLYGSHLACGGTLGAGTLGVANKWLPCGARVTLHHAGRTIRVPVIDRGPYAGAREYDLTEATAQRLGFHGAGTIWVTR